MPLGWGQCLIFTKSNMKKKNERIPVCCRVILLTCFLCFFFQGGYAQLNLSSGRAKLEVVLEKITSQSSYRFFYNDALKEVMVNAANVKDVSINTLLDKLFRDTGLSYRISGNVIYLTYNKVKQEKVKEEHPQKGPRTISGKVIDEQGEPLIGVSIRDKATGNAVITDINGCYSIAGVSEKSVLEFTYVGYSNHTVTANNHSTIDVKMREKGRNLNEVVVTALGIKRSDKALSYNVQKLKASQLLAVKEASVPNALSGKIAGVTVSQGASGIGGSTKVVMRGDKSVNPDGNNNALYVLDGIPLPDLFPKRASSSNGQYGGVDEGDGISSINMEDIAEVTVLTGPSAAALYGGQAANGVVMLTSKQGGMKDGKPRISFSHYSDFYHPFVLPELQNTYGSRTGEFASWGPKLKDPAKYQISSIRERVILIV